MKTHGMTRCTRNGVVFFQFPLFSAFDHLRHAVFSRVGGYSAPPFQSLNASVGVGDDASNVRKNRDVISRSLNVKAETLVFARQDHGTCVLRLTDAGPQQNGDAARVIGTGDAMVTKVKGRYLSILVADCQAVALYDPNRKVVANIHSGWRGSIANIIGRTVDVMVREYRCLPRDLVAGVSPSLGPCCAEFKRYRSEIPEKYWHYKDARHHFDFWALSDDQLRAEGIPPKNISISRICTKCRQDLFFSYRGRRPTGRFAAVIGMNG